MIRVRVEPRSSDQGSRKNDAFTFSTTLPINKLAEVYHPITYCKTPKTN